LLRQIYSWQYLLLLLLIPIIKYFDTIEYDDDDHHHGDGDCMVQNLGIRPFYEKIENENSNDNSQKRRYFLKKVVTNDSIGEIKRSYLFLLE
jgi:hypothetical protein